MTGSNLDKLEAKITQLLEAFDRLKTEKLQSSAFKREYKSLNEQLQKLSRDKDKIQGRFRESQMVFKRRLERIIEKIDQVVS